MWYSLSFETSIHLSSDLSVLFIPIQDVVIWLVFINDTISCISFLVSIQGRHPPCSSHRDLPESQVSGTGKIT